MSIKDKKATIKEIAWLVKNMDGFCLYEVLRFCRNIVKSD